ncbi:MAG: spondin domain-containing protein [Planctomycetales bacterium]|nr:spondin domain-containing protein [Planctomycetales bacterium]
MHYRSEFPFLPAILLAACASTTWAQASTSTPSTPGDYRITFTNEGGSDLTLTPLWFAFQDGGFDLFNPGESPTAGLELLAEDGDPSVLIGEFNAAAQPGNRQGVVLAPAGFPGAPVVEPGETGVAYITATSPASYQYFSFASMVIPSNDTFIGNPDPLQYQVFDASGAINDPSGVFTIQVFAANFWDAGTELNNGQGAAFSTIGGSPTDTNDGIGAAGDLTEFLGTTTPSGLTINNLPGSADLVATITISQVPEPASWVCVLLSVAPAVTRRWR